MPAPAKLLNEYGVLVGLEGSYGTPATLIAASDGFLVSERPVMPTPEYTHGGERRGGRGPGGARLRRVKKLGRHGRVQLVHEASGAQAVQTSTSWASVHELLRMCGLSATLATAVHTYAPEKGQGASGTIEVYDGEQMARLTGAIGNFKIEANELGGVPVWLFDMIGMMPALPSDAAVPTITYTPADSPPVLENAVVTIGTYLAGIVRSFEFDGGRPEASPRADINVAGNHAGFSRSTPITPSIKIVLEATDLVGSPYHTTAGLDPYQLAELATAIALQLKWGSAANNIFQIDAAQAQLAEVPTLEEDGATAIWTLNFDLMPSVPGLVDCYSISTPAA